MKKLLILILFLIILFFSSNILAIDEISPNITIIFPENNSILNDTLIWLNWTADETLDWCAYSINDTTNTSFVAEGEYTSDRFDTAGSGNANPVGITQNGTYIWIVDILDDEVYKYYMNGAYTGDSFDTATSGGTSPQGITNNGTYIWIVDFGNKEVYKYYMNGTYTGDSFDTAASGNTFPGGITQNGTYIWIVNFLDDGVYKYYMNGTYTGDSFVTSGNGYPVGITNNGTYIWITNEVPEKVYKYWINGTYTGYSFSVTGNGYPADITQNETYFWTIDHTDDEVYKYFFGNFKNCINRTITAVEGQNNVTIYAKDTAGNMGQSDYVYFTVDTTPPNISDKFINETSPVFPNTIVCLNVSGVSDNFQLDEVWAEVTQSNGTIFNITMTDTGSCAGISEDGWYSADVNVGDSLGSFYYNASYVNDTAGNINANTTIQNLALANIIDLSNLIVRYIQGTKRIFKFLITNNMNSRLDDVSWALDTGETVKNSTRNISLGPHKTIFVNVHYNYINPGTYNVTATAYSNGLSDSETIEVTI